MKLAKRIIALICLIFLLMPGTAMADAAITGDYNYQPGGFYVVVDAPDGYVNFRYGPGLEYGINFPIYNGEILFINTTADNYYDGLWWGQVDYNGEYGWISISQTSMIDDPYETPQPEPEPEPETLPPEPVTQEPVTQALDFADPAGTVITGIRNTGYLVEDAFYQEDGPYLYTIPVINLESSEILDLNVRIYEEFYPMIQSALSDETPWEELTDSTYTWNLNGDTLSLLIYKRFSGPWHEYEVYNISVSEQRILENRSVINAGGYTQDSFLETAARAMEQRFHASNDERKDMAPDWYDKSLDFTMSSENLEAVMPYLNGDGQLCVIAEIGLVGTQNSTSWSEICLANPTPDTTNGTNYVRIISGNGSAALYPEPGNDRTALEQIWYGQKVYITNTASSEDGRIWGYTAYNGKHGWIALDETVEAR